MNSNKPTSVNNPGLAWALKAIQELAPSESGPFTRWLNKADHSSLNAVKADFAHIVLPAEMLQADAVSCLPDWLTDHQSRLIKELCSGTFGGQLGVISDNLAIFWLDAGGTNSGRLLLLGLELIATTVSELYPSNQLTRSELRTLVQLTMGQTLQEAATSDELSYETKRSHLKAVFSKTNTRRQAEITANLLSHIIINFGSVTHKSIIDDKHQTFYQYIQDCLPKSTRHHILVNAAGTQTRYLDFGPVSGTPVIFLHHMGIVYFTDQEIDHLTTLNLRLICPLRNGALGNKDEPMLVDSHMAHALEGISMAQRMFCDAPITLACPLSSCFYGLEFLRKHTIEVKNIIFIGAAFKGPAKSTTAEKFRNYFFGIALKNHWLLDKLTQYITNQTEKSNAIKLLFEKGYADSPFDLEILNTEFSDPKLSHAFKYRIRHSLTSAQHDLYHQAIQNWASLPLSDTRLHFIHGEQDGLHPISSVREFARQSNNATVYPVPDAGSFIYHHHTPTSFAKIQSIASTSEHQLHQKQSSMQQ